jgi:NAD(P)-dependent dehydrogenase (short-subunit alcohol dehydrogenase family)
MHPSLSGRHYVVIGASSGIGSELLRQLQERGAHVHAWGRKSLEGHSVQWSHWDVLSGEPAPATSLPDTLHGLAYMPGNIPLKPFHRTGIADFLQTMNLNLLGAVQSIQAALPALKNAGGASVVLMSTVAARVGMPFHSCIATAKAALEGLTLSLASEYAAQQIRFNAVAPSLTNTPLAGSLLTSPEKVEASGKRHPLGRVGEAREPASAVRFLLDPESSWVTGQIWGVDGGMAHIKGF